MTSLLEQDKRARLRALDPTASFIVQAPAGSGKTELLTQRVLKLLSTVKRAPEEIMAVTFTKKAQAEMRHRIIQALQKAQKSPPETEHELQTWYLAKEALSKSQEMGWDLLNNPNRLKIMTIDALSHHLVHRLPIMSQFGVEPKILDLPFSTYQMAIDAFLKDVLEKVDKAQSLSTLLWHLDNRLDKIIPLLIKLLEKRDQWLKLVVPCAQSPEKGLEEIALSIRRMISDKLTELFHAIDVETQRFILREANQSGENLFSASLNETLQSMREWDAFPDASLSDFPKWRCLCDWLLTKDKTVRKRLTIEQGFLSPSSAKGENKMLLTSRKKAFESFMVDLEDKEWVRLLKEVSTLPDIDFNNTERDVLTSLFDLLPLLVAHLKVCFKQKGAVDFIEMAEGALQALGTSLNPTDLALSLDYQIQHILIDEFQDTSVIQFQLFEQLVTTWLPDEGKTLFLVGDPQQSIYRFRGAEVGLFLRVVEQGLQQVPLTFLQLRRNFRASPLLTDWSNQHLKPLFPASHDVAMGAVKFSESVPGTVQKGSVQMLCFASKQQEHVRIASLVKEYTADNGHVAILVRSKSHLAELIPVLRAHQINFRATDIERLTCSTIVMDLVSLLQAILDLSNKTAWLAVLRAPWLDLKLSDLWCLAHDINKPIVWENIQDPEILKTLSQEGQQQIVRFKTTYATWLQSRKRSTLTDFLKSLWLNLGGPLAYDKELLPHADAFFESVACSEVGGDLESWEDFEKRLNDSFALGENKLSDDSMCQVELMSIHKAKGLEFDVVIMPSIEKAPRASDPELLLWQERPHHAGVDWLIAPAKGVGDTEDKLYYYLNHLSKEKEYLESARLLYVGVTRAKKHLILTSTYAPKDESQPLEARLSKRSFLGMLLPFVEATLVFEKESVCADNHVRIERVVASDWCVPERLLHQISKSSDLSPEDKNRPTQANQVEVHVGTLVHLILQLIAFDGIEAWEGRDLHKLQPAWCAQLLELGVAKHELDHAVTLVKICIENTLQSEKGRWILSNHSEAKSEYALAYWRKSALHTSVIDRTFVERGVRWIVDYKVVQSCQQVDIQKYEDQLLHYTNLMRTMDNRPIRCGLYFPLTDQWEETTLEQEVT